MIDSDWLVGEAETWLAAREPGQPRQTKLKRIVSDLYYALFHALCRQVADLHVGATAVIRSSKRYALMYRALDHSRIKKVMQDVAKVGDASEEAVLVAATFIALQEARHKADYDPHARFRLSQVKAFASDTRRAISVLGHGFTEKELLLTRLIANSRP